MHVRDHAPGFFGKLPSHGDFVGRRLPLDMRQCFDNWIQAGLLHSRQVMGAGWLPTWLNSPLWRFVVAAGVCGEQAWCGVMMPSHDRVGRCFPLVLAAGSEVAPCLHDCLTVRDAWFSRLEEVALSALDDISSLEALDQALLAIPRVSSCSVCCTENSPLQDPMASLGTEIPSGSCRTLGCGRSAWWTVDPANRKYRLAVFHELPQPAEFVSLLDGGLGEREA
jgi:type VI secretion system protein ImpM